MGEGGETSACQSFFSRVKELYSVFHILNAFIIGLNLQIRLILKALSKHLFCLWKISVFLYQYFEEKMDTSISNNQPTMDFFEVFLSIRIGIPE